MTQAGTLLVINADATTDDTPNTYEGIRRGVGDTWFSFVHATERIGFYIQDEGMLDNQPLNVVASMLANCTLWGPVVLCRGMPDDEGDTVPVSQQVHDLALGMCASWRNVIAYGTRVGQDLTVLPNADTIPPPTFREMTPEEIIKRFGGGDE